MIRFTPSLLLTGLPAMPPRGRGRVTSIAMGCRTLSGHFSMHNVTLGHNNAQGHDPWYTCTQGHDPQRRCTHTTWQQRRASCWSAAWNNVSCKTYNRCTLNVQGNFEESWMFADTLPLPVSHGGGVYSIPWCSLPAAHAPPSCMLVSCGWSARAETDLSFGRCCCRPAATPART